MRSIRFFLTIWCALAAIVPDAFCGARAAEQVPANYPVKILPPATEIASPFALNAPASKSANAIEFLDQEAMSSQDRAAVISAMPAIQSRVALAGFSLEQGNWSYHQIVCPVLPEHVLLLYSRNEGADNLSQFSVAIPRDGKSTVRVVPILRRSFSPYTPAPVSPLTIATFNRVRDNGQTGEKPDWLVTGLCYAALAGVHVTLVPADTGRGKSGPMRAMTPLLEIGIDGGNTVQFVDVENAQKPKEWDLIFDSKGKLVKVEVSAAPPLQIRMLP